MTTMEENKFEKAAQNYLAQLNKSFTPEILKKVECMCEQLYSAWVHRRHIFICGNGGSAANAIHIANDLLYGVGACGTPPIIPGMNVEALPSNSGIITCLANDTGYENIYSKQLTAKAGKDDLLIALSGSGNSENIINAIIAAKELEMKSIAILAYNGGKCKDIADLPIHLPISDMQIAEDTQLIIGHLCMQWLRTDKPKNIQI